LCCRRKAIAALATLPLSFAVGGISPKQNFGAELDRITDRSGMGLVIYDVGIQRKLLLRNAADQDLFAPLNLLKYVHELGGGGIQASLGILSLDEIRALNDYAQAHELYIEAIVQLPNSPAAIDKFQAEMRTAAAVGALAARTTIMPGRRYEQFKSWAEFKAAADHGRKMLESVATWLEKQQVPLAVENHKDQRLDERLALFEQLSSPAIRACVDTGNSFALLEDPYEIISALAPYASSVHLKDQALAPYADGFLLGDIPLGQGAFDLPRMISILRNAQPDIRFSLELITRDALRVPCLSESYWATLANVPATDLARSLRLVHENSTLGMQQVSSLPEDQQAQLERQNLVSSIQYARDILHI
jgi:sugar phosphate isomerase/epimerase